MDANADIQEFTFTYFLQQVLGINAAALMRFTVGVLFVLYLAAVLWTYKDASKRYKDPTMVLLWTLTVVVTNIFGLAVYLIMRPDLTLEEDIMLRLNQRALKVYTSRVVVCYQCKAISVIDETGKLPKHCWKCGARLVKECTKCGTINLYKNKYCVECGHNLTPKEGKASKKKNNK